MAKKVNAEDFERFVREVAGALTMIGADLGKMQTLLYASLNQQGFIDEVKCPHCKEELMIPTLPDIEKSSVCPACGEDIYEGTQTTFETWDLGGEEE
jgi:formylmethanofuran dehydrogenase subunit E